MHAYHKTKCSKRSCYRICLLQRRFTNNYFYTFIYALVDYKSCHWQHAEEESFVIAELSRR